MGPKWERLSALVHKLFETAIGRLQGPADQFFALDELSYIVTFRNLTAAESNLACVAIAKEVCAALYGDQIDGSLSSQHRRRDCPVIWWRGRVLRHH